jgi:crotonobetainyl-CoA:carnitine CoA-transferase CaiB-like acyl-CoA transferase
VKPLEGVVVLDLTRFLAGPYCAMFLAGLGAEVIKVEPPGGDPYRDRAPYGGSRGVHATRQTPDDVSLPILQRARGKKSLTLNLRAPAGLALFRRLCASADVVVENYLPGTLEAMGLDYPALRALNPRLILCSISGFGQEGARRDWRAFDPVVQAMSGMSSVTGYPDRPGVRSGAAIGDTAASLHGVIGVLAALQARARTGEGDWVDVAMLDGALFLLADVVEFANAGRPLERLGNGHAGTVPFNNYRARDGWVTICAVTADEWHRVLAAFGRPELAADPRFAPAAASRLAHRADVDALMSEWTGQRTVAEVVETLQKHHVAAGPVRDLAETLDDEHLLAREMVLPLAHPAHGPIPGGKGVGVPIKLRNHPVGLDSPAPAPGAHNAEILGRLGLGPADLESLRADGVI